KLDTSFLHVFGALCYPKNDREDIRKLGAKGDIGFFIGYSANSRAYRIYNRRTKKIMETMNVSFDELSAMAFEQRSSKPGLQCMTYGQISSGLDLTYAPSTITTQQPTEGFAKQPIVENLLKVGKTIALSNLVTSNSVSTPQESKGIDNTKTRRPQPRSNTKNDRVPSASKSSRSQNKEAEVEEHHRIYCFLRITNIYHQHNVNVKNSCGKNQKAKVSVKEIQKKYQPKVAKPKKVGTRESLATPKPRKPRFLLRWSPTGRMFDQEGKLAASSNSESQYNCSNGDNACTSNTMEPKIKRFLNSTTLLDMLFRYVYGASIRVVPSI
nr:Gag-Pol polyprotein [Tanacetum cinerariifolium]